MSTTTKHTAILNAVIEGLKRSMQKLIDKNSKADEDLLIIDENGKAIRVKAKELKNKI